MTIAVSSNARKKRLSIDRRAGRRLPLKAPDRSRRDGMGDTAQFGGVRASYRVTLRVVQALRWHRWNSWDNNGMPQVAGARMKPDTHGHTERA